MQQRRCNRRGAAEERGDGKRKVNISMYGSMRFDEEHSAEDKAQALCSAVVEHRDKLRNWKSIRKARSREVSWRATKGTANRLQPRTATWPPLVDLPSSARPLPGFSVGQVTDLEFDAFEKWVSETYSSKGRPPTEEEALEFGRSMAVTDYNPPIDPREPRFDRVRDSLGKAMPF